MALLSGQSLLEDLVDIIMKIKNPIEFVMIDQLVKAVKEIIDNPSIKKAIEILVIKATELANQNIKEIEVRDMLEILQPTIVRTILYDPDAEQTIEQLKKNNPSAAVYINQIKQGVHQLIQAAERKINNYLPIVKKILFDDLEEKNLKFAGYIKWARRIYNVRSSILGNIIFFIVNAAIKIKDFTIIKQSFAMIRALISVKDSMLVKQILEMAREMILLPIIYFLDGQNGLKVLFARTTNALRVFSYIRYNVPESLRKIMAATYQKSDLTVRRNMQLMAVVSRIPKVFIPIKYSEDVCGTNAVACVVPVYNKNREFQRFILSFSSAFFNTHPEDQIESVRHECFHLGTNICTIIKGNSSNNPYTNFDEWSKFHQGVDQISRGLNNFLNLLTGNETNQHQRKIFGKFKTTISRINLDPFGVIKNSSFITRMLVAAYGLIHNENVLISDRCEIKVTNSRFDIIKNFILYRGKRFEIFLSNVDAFKFAMCRFFEAENTYRNTKFYSAELPAYVTGCFNDAQVCRFAPEYFSYNKAFNFNCIQELNKILGFEYIQPDEQQPIIEGIDCLLSKFTESFEQNFYLSFYRNLIRNFLKNSRAKKYSDNIFNVMYTLYSCVSECKPDAAYALILKSITSQFTKRLPLSKKSKERIMFLLFPLSRLAIDLLFEEYFTLTELLFISSTKILGTSCGLYSGLILSKILVDTLQSIIYGRAIAHTQEETSNANDQPELQLKNIIWSFVREMRDQYTYKDNEIKRAIELIYENRQQFMKDGVFLKSDISNRINNATKYYKTSSNLFRFFICSRKDVYINFNDLESNLKPNSLTIK